MIRLLEVPGKGSLPREYWGEPFGARIVSNAEQYGARRFFSAWVQEAGGAVTAAIGKLDTALTVSVHGDADFVELREFIELAGWGSVLGEAGVMRRLNLTGGTQEGPVMARKNGPPTQPRHSFYERVPIREIHGLLKLCETETFRVPDWEPFYLDVSHRVRHGGTQVETVFLESGLLAACALTAAESPQTAVLGAVAVHPSLRGQGLGRRVVEGLLSRLGQERAVALSEERGFYEKLGFETAGAWVQTVR